MKKNISGILVTLLLLVGCSNDQIQTDPPNSKPYVYFFSNDQREPIYYKLTKEKIGNVGKKLGIVSTGSSGPSGWGTNIKSKVINIRELSDKKIKQHILSYNELNKINDVAVQYSKNGSYFKAIKQSKKP